MRKTFRLVLVASAIFGLASCGPAAPGAQYQTAVLTPHKLGSPFQVEGCEVQGYRMTTRATSVPNGNVFVAKCPTATVTSETEQRGQLNSQSAVITPVAALPTTNPTVEDKAELSNALALLAKDLSKLREDLKTAPAPDSFGQVKTRAELTLAIEDTSDRIERLQVALSKTQP